MPEPLLTDVNGLGAAYANRLAQHGITTPAQLAAAPLKTVAAVPGIGRSRAVALRAAAGKLLSAAGSAPLPPAARIARSKPETRDTQKDPAKKSREETAKGDGKDSKKKDEKRGKKKDKKDKKDEKKGKKKDEKRGKKNKKDKKDEKKGKKADAKKKDKKKSKKKDEKRGKKGSR